MYEIDHPKPGPYETVAVRVGQVDLPLIEVSLAELDRYGDRDRPGLMGIPAAYAIVSESRLALWPRPTVAFEIVSLPGGFSRARHRVREVVHAMTLHNIVAAIHQEAHQHHGEYPSRIFAPEATRQRWWIEASAMSPSYPQMPDLGPSGEMRLLNVPVEAREGPVLIAYEVGGSDV